MSKAVVGLFDERAEAQRAIDELRQSGFGQSEVSLVTSAADSVKLLDNLDALLPASDVRFYREGVRQGGTLVVVESPEARASEAARILARFNIVDVDARSAQYRQSGSDFQLRDYDKGDYVLPVVEEELQVGKQTVERGRMRIYTRVTERPVEEQVTLREERVHVERRPVDRPVTDADLAAMKDTTVEYRETAEEAVVTKRARVIEEVVVGKEVSEHTETVHDTVRRTEVSVDQLGGQNVAGSSYDALDADFRSYYRDSDANSGYSYDEYRPVFSYGHDLATNERYRGKDWSAIEADARKDWEARNPGTWEQFKDSVRYAWSRARGKA